MEALKLSQAVAQAEGRRGAIREEMAGIDLEIEKERAEMAEAQARLEEGGNKISEMTDKLMEFEQAQQLAANARWPTRASASMPPIARRRKPITSSAPATTRSSRCRRWLRSW